MHGKLIKTKREVERAEEEEDYKLFCFTPAICQCFNNAKGFLFVYCVFAIVAGCMIGGVTNANLAALERRFGLDSSASALIVVSYDIAFCIITVFVTYFGAKSHIPRYISVGAAIFGLGALIYALPHFITPLYDYGDDILSDFCSKNSTTCNTKLATDLRYNMYILLFGQLLMGFGATPLYTLGVAYIEDSVPKDKAPIYLGIANACALFGPVIGFTCGGSLLSYFYVDFDGINVDSLGFDRNDPRWVGAWWIAPLVLMLCCWSTILPFYGFPKQLPGTAKNRLERVSEVHRTGNLDSIRDLASNNSLENIPRTILVLLRNPVYALFIVAGCLSGGTVAGATSFLAKFVQNEFHATAGTSAILTGATLVPAAATGHLVAGIIVSKYKWKTPQIILYTTFCCLIASGLTPAFLIRCNNISVAGVSSNYRVDFPLLNKDLTSPCNSNCGCQQEFYFPSCGTDMLTYFSPCHAGCTTEHENNETQIKTYYNCSCVQENIYGKTNFEASVQPGYCEQSCSKIALFLPLLFLSTFFVFQSHTTSMVVAFRIVPESLRAFAVGLAWLFFRALGTIPGPILFGKFTDSTCVLWQFRQCTQSRGSCWIYNSKSMSVTFMSLALIGNLLTGIVFAISWIVYKPPQNDEHKYIDNDESLPPEKANGRDNPGFKKETE